MIIDYQWTGTYTVNPNGTGTLSITVIKVPPDPAPAPVCTPDPPPEGGVCTDYIAPSPLSPVPAYVGPETFAFVISSRYKRVSLVQQSNSGSAQILLQGFATRQFRVTTPFFFTTGTLHTTYAVQLGPVTSFAAIAPGDPGGVAGAPRQDVMRVGSIKFDGLGMATGQMIATTQDNAGTTIIVSYQWLGPYTMNSDGTGTLSMNPAAIPDTACTPVQLPGVCAMFEGPETYAFTVSKSNQQMYLIQTDNVGGGAKLFMRGDALPQ
jgi:hypothetical protein